jgi:hypothetical protein
MHVRVDEAWDHRAARQIDRARAGPCESSDIRGTTDRDDLAVAYGERFVGGELRVDREDLPIDEDSVGCLTPRRRCDRQSSADECRESRCRSSRLLMSRTLAQPIDAQAKACALQPPVVAASAAATTPQNRTPAPAANRKS